ncbi:MAG TPA: valine--tRNA ligase [Chthoniobacteraceae bacterium]|nr:valine--tRNA ligase [Chthoniobacteraceae bacterium]
MSEISKTYEPQAVEEKWYARWLADGCFTADPASSKPAYSIAIPPPNVTGVLTLGHVLNNTLQDVLARRARMQGHEVLWLPGTDHAGIATQTVVERRLRKEEKKTRHDLGRKAFLERVWEWKEEHGGLIIKQLKRLGASCDWSRERFTMDEAYSRAVQKVFVDLYEKGLIYRGKRMVNWCPVSLTALSDEEVIMKQQNGVLYHMRYEVVEEPGRYLEIATTRPETLMGDTAVAVHPDDERYKELIGKRVWRPFPKAAIPIVGDEHIDPQFGTGVLKVTPAHDKADFEIGQRHGLEAIDVLNPDGTLNELAGEEFAGKDRFAVRKLAAEKLGQMGLLVKEEPYQNNVGFSERADVPIEPRLSLQWFLKYPAVEAAREAVASGEIRFRPERWTNVYEHWMENIQDWCISRQLWWGHRIPVWYRRDDEREVYVGLEPPADPQNWVQEEDVLDTWFSSWLWPFATMDEPTLAKFYPTSDLVTGPDIIFFWVARMIMAGYEFTDSKPFSNVFYTGLIRDLQGRKMSKSLGNSPDPLELIGRYGADGIRFGLLRIAPQGQDIRFDEKQVEEGRNFANKLWNAARFRLMHGPGEADPQPDEAQLSSYGLDILAKLDRLIAQVNAAYGEYRFNEVAQLLYDFFWSEYCDWYVEASKSEIFSDDPAAKASTLKVIDVILSRLLRLLQPLMPHLTAELWETLGYRAPGHGSDHLMYAAWPEPTGIEERLREKVECARQRVADVYQSVRLARNIKAEYRVPSGKKVRFFLKAAPEWIDAELETLARLVHAEAITVDNAYQPAAGVPRILTPVGELYMPLEGVVDIAAESARLEKEIGKVEGELATVRRKLSSEKFVNHAPAAVVAEHRQREVDWNQRLAHLQKMRAALKG